MNITGTITILKTILQWTLHFNITGFNHEQWQIKSSPKWSVLNSVIKHSKDNKG